MLDQDEISFYVVYFYQTNWDELVAVNQVDSALKMQIYLDRRVEI